MWHKSTYLAAVLGAVLSTSVSRLGGAVATPSAEAFWRCPSGYTFETSGTAVHCKRAAWTETRAAGICAGPTQSLKVDLVGTTDMCAAGVGQSDGVEPVCDSADVAVGFTKRRVAGKDFCAKSHPADIIAPNQKVSL
jgi:hypothetical protein